MEDEIPPEMQAEIRARLKEETGQDPGKFSTKMVGKFEIHLCETHDALLRAEISDRNLSFFLLPDDDKERYRDPFHRSVSMFMHEVMETGGPGAIMKLMKEGRKTVCPLCVVLEHGDEEVVTGWIHGAVDAIWQEMHKVGKVSNVVQ